MMISLQHSRIILTISGIISYILLTIALIITWNTPAAGYEPDIYAATPLIFWIALFFGMGLGTLLIVHQITRYNVPKRFRHLGFSLVGICSLSLAALCIIRGYFSINISGDTGSHVGIIYSIIAKGVIGKTYYPGLYSESSVFSIVSGVDVMDLISLFPLWFLFIFILGIFLLARHLFPDIRAAYLTTLVALFLPFGTATLIGCYPLFFVAMMGPGKYLPLVFYIILRAIDRQSMEHFILAVVFFVAMIFYHPIISIALILFLIATLVTYTVPVFSRYKPTIKQVRRLTAMTILLTGMFIYWIWDFYGWNIVSGILSIFGDNDKNIAETTDLFSSAVGSGYGIDSILRIAGINLMLYVFLLISVFIFMRYYIRDERYFSLRVVFVYLICLGGVTVLLSISTADFNYTRFISAVYTICILMSGFVLSQILSIKKQQPGVLKKYRKGIVCTLLILVLVLSVLSIHPSPYTLNTGYQTTETEWDAMATLLPRLDMIDNNVNITGIWFSTPQRYVTVLYHSEYRFGTYAFGTYQVVSSSALEKPEIMPFNFGYNLNPSLSDSFKNTTYMFIIEKDRELYQVYYPNLAEYRWSSQNFIQLEMDPNVIRTYSNGGFDLYTINPNQNYAV